MEVGTFIVTDVRISHSVSKAEILVAVSDYSAVFMIQRAGL
jgi:hypothetical protein